MTTELRAILLLFFMLLHDAIFAVPNAGSCADTNFKFPPTTDPNIIDTTIPVRVLKEGALLYDSDTGSTSIRSLKFDERFKPLKQQEQRIQVGKPNTSSPEGWIEKHDLLCNFTPLNEKGLPRKAFVKIPIDSAENYFIPSYPSPEEPTYGDESKILNKISAFRNFFIFSEDIEQKRFLLSPIYNIASTEFTPLIGWIGIEHIIQWKTNLGIRPQEHVEHVSGYLSLTDSGKPLNDKDKVEGVELTGGKIWYTFPIHMPLLDTVGEHYKVAASGTGILGFMPLDSGASAFNEADLFFVLDGTASMDPYIKSAQQVIENIVNILENSSSNQNSECKIHPDFREASFRCGFLIYRDRYADARKDVNCKNGLCEFQALSPETCNTSDSSCSAVIDALSKVKSTTNDSDDYEELLFDALAKSTSLIASCPKRNKLLVVIGDHGDKQDHLPQNIIDTLTTEPKVTPFFVQTNSNQFNIKNSDKYITAYTKFHDQSLDILSRMEISRDFFIPSLSASETPCKIVEDFLNISISPMRVNQLDTMLRNGESVKNAINKLNDGDMSVLFWKRIEEKVCENMPKQCNEPVKHRVNEFFIPADKENFVEELLLVEFHIQKWRELFKPLTDLNAPLSAQDKRKKLQELATTGVQRVLGDPPIAETDTRALEEIIAEKKIALPVRPQSPLFQYSPYDFSVIVDCEVERIIEWIKGIDSILAKIVSYPNQKILVDFKDYDEKTADCPLSEKGKRIKKVVLDNNREFLAPSEEERRKMATEEEKNIPDSKYRYGHSVDRNIVLYWVPLEYLP